MTQQTTAQTPDATQIIDTPSWYRWIQWAIVGLAVGLRLLLPGLAPLDEVGAGALLRAEDLLGGVIPFTGAPAPAGDLVQPPTGAYLDALALTIWRDPRAVVLLHGLVAGLAAALVFDLTRRCYSYGPALVAGLAYALHPLAIQAARDVGPAAWIAPIAALALHGLVLVFHARDPRGWLEAGLAAGLALGTHLAAWPIVAAVLLGMAIFWQHARCPETIVGLGAGLLVALPHLAYQIRHGFYDVTGTWGFGSAASVQGLWAGLCALAQSGSTWSAPSGFAEPVIVALAVLTALLSVGAIVATLALALQRWARSVVVDQLAPEFLLIGWLLIGTLGIALTTRDLGQVGRAMMIPAASACLGATMSPRLGPAWQRVRRGLTATLLVALGLMSLSGYAAQRPNLRATQALRQHLAEAVTSSDDLYFLAEPNAPSPYGPRGWRYLLADCHPIVVEPEDGVLALPLPLGRDACYVLPAPASQQLAALEALDAESLTIPNRSKGYTPLLYRLPAANPAQILALARQRADVPFAAGIHLLGYTWPTDKSCDTSANLTTTWLITEPVQEGRPKLLIQLLADGQPVAESNGLGLDVRLWQPDTAVIAWHPITPGRLTPGRYQLALGFYDADTLEPYPPTSSPGDAILMTGLAVSRPQ